MKNSSIALLGLYFVLMMMIGIPFAHAETGEIWSPPYNNVTGAPNNTCNSYSCAAFSVTNGEADEYNSGGVSCGDSPCGISPNTYITWDQCTICGGVGYTSGDSVYWEQHLSFQGFISVDDASGWVQLNYWTIYCNNQNSCSTTEDQWVIMSQTSLGSANQTYSSSGTDYKLIDSNPQPGGYGLYVGQFAELYVSAGEDSSGGGTVNFYPSSYESTSYMTLQFFDVYA